MTKILISPGFGAGWSSWHNDCAEAEKFMLTYQPFIDIIESKGTITEADKEKFNEDYEAKFGDNIPYMGGVYQLIVYEVNGPFKIEEYDGSERVVETGDLISFED